MRRVTKKEAEIEELAMLFLRLADKHGYCLRVNNRPQGEFVYKPVRGGFETEENGSITVDLGDKSVNAIKFDRKCLPRNLHEVLVQMKVPHKYENSPEESHIGIKELHISLYYAKKLEEACDLVAGHTEQKLWQERARSSGKKSASHSPS
jgi:hypothetical protein